jgi:hypothetical protein
MKNRGKLRIRLHVHRPSGSGGRVGLQYFTLSERLRSALGVANMDLRLFQNATALCDLTVRDVFGLYFRLFPFGHFFNLRKIVNT